jgi:hypothetical protein
MDRPEVTASLRAQQRDILMAQSSPASRFFGRTGAELLGVGGAIRAMVASLDMSWWRHVMMLANPLNMDNFVHANIDSLRSTFSEKYAQDLMDGIKAHKHYRTYEEFNMDFLRPLNGSEVEIARRTEEFMFANADTFAGRKVMQIPWLRLSERAHVMGANSMAWQVFVKHLDNLENIAASGIRTESNPGGRLTVGTGSLTERRFLGGLTGDFRIRPTDVGSVTSNNPQLNRQLNREIKALGNMIEDMVGRTQLPRKFGIRDMSPVINAGFFAARLNISRVAVLRNLFSDSQYVRRTAWKNMLSSVATLSGILILGEQLGLWSVEKDARSSDFWAIRVGRTRVDPWGGHRQWAVLSYRLANVFREEGAMKSVSTGELSPIDANIAWHFSRTKLAPAISIALSLWFSTDYKGERIDRTDLEYWLRQGMPIIASDVIESMEELGFPTGLRSLPATMVGMGGATYSVSENDILRELGYKYVNYADLDPGIRSHNRLREVVRKRLDLARIEQKERLLEVEKNYPPLRAVVMSNIETAADRKARLEQRSDERRIERARRIRDAMERQRNESGGDSAQSAPTPPSSAPSGSLADFLRQYQEQQGITR